MKKHYPYINDLLCYSSENRKFIDQVENAITQNQRVKITLLDWMENPIKEIQGILTGGAITKDGSSSVRRSGSLTASLSAGEYDVEDLNADFSINKKIFIEFGIENVTNYYKEYSTLWFPQGVFFISDFNFSINATSALSINLSLKDKMSLLNGDIGGKFSSTTVLDEVDDIDETGVTVSKKVLIFDLIQELVHHFGGEPLENILIEDIPLRIKKVMKWTGDTPLFLRREVDNDGNVTYAPSLSPANEEGSTNNEISYSLGEDVGYVYSDFVWTEELVANAGDNICAILDTIKSGLGNFEYFYDEFGVFHFREIKNYLNTTKSTSLLSKMDAENYLVDISQESYAKIFDDKNLISLSVSPQYNNIKNDFVVQGLRKATGSDISYPIYYHLAIDNKPALNTYEDVLFYKESEDAPTRATFCNEDFFEKSESGSIPYGATDKATLEAMRDNLIIDNLRTNENIFDALVTKAEQNPSMKTDQIIYHTAKTEEIEVVSESGDNLIEYLVSKNEIEASLDRIKNDIAQEITKLPKHREYNKFCEELQNRDKKIFDFYKEYASEVKLKKITRQEILDAEKTFLSIDEQPCNQELLNDSLNRLFNLYLAAGYCGAQTFEELYDNLIKLIQKKPNIFSGSWSQKKEDDSARVLLGKRTYVIQDEITGLIHFYEHEMRETRTSQEIDEDPSIANEESAFEGEQGGGEGFGAPSAIEDDVEYEENESSTLSMRSANNNKVEQKISVDEERQAIVKSLEEHEVQNKYYRKFRRYPVGIVSDLLEFPEEHYPGEEDNNKNYKTLFSSFEYFVNAAGELESKEELTASEQEVLKLLKKKIKRDNQLRTIRPRWNIVLKNFYGSAQDIANYTMIIDWLERNKKLIEEKMLNLDKEEETCLDMLYPKRSYYLELEEKINLRKNFFETGDFKTFISTFLEESESIKNFLSLPSYEGILDYTKKQDFTEQMNLERGLLEGTIDAFRNKILNRIDVLDNRSNKVNALFNELKAQTKEIYNYLTKNFSDQENNILEDMDRVEASLTLQVIKERRNILENNLEKTNKYLSNYLTKKQIAENDFRLGVQRDCVSPFFSELKKKFSIPENMTCLKETYVRWNGLKWEEVIFDGKSPEGGYQVTDWRTELYLQGLRSKKYGLDNNSRDLMTFRDANFYFEELDAFWPEIYDLKNGKFYGEDEKSLCNGNYFLDFIEPSTSSYGEFCVNNIGRRQNVTADDKINCLFAADVPDIILLNTGDPDSLQQLRNECQDNGQAYCQLSPEMYWALNVGGSRNPAFDQIKYDLFLYTNYKKTISMTSLPIMYLEPNTRITLQSERTNTFGNYMIQSINLTLGSGGSMSINANEIFERF